MIHLTRRVAIHSFDVEATVALGRNRPEFLAVARLAADLDRPIGARDVLRELLGPRPEVLGWRVIERCVALGLLERREERGAAALTSAGRMALAYGEVLVQEEGIWRFFLVDDPLVPAGVVHVARLETEPVWKERKSMKEDRNRGEREAEPDVPPKLLQQAVGAEPRESIQNGHLFQVLHLGRRGAEGPSGQVALVLTFDPEAALRFDGKLPSDGQVSDDRQMEGALRIPEVLDQVDYRAMWQALVTHATGTSADVLASWEVNAGRKVVPTSFHDLDPAARKAFRLDLQVQPSQWRGLGSFDATQLRATEIVPASDSDAQQWLRWLQWDAIGDYAAPMHLETAAQELKTKFPFHRPTPAGPDQLLQQALDRPSGRSSYLLAPYDLGLWR